MTRFLVTVGAGFIGSNLVKRLIIDGDGEVRVIDNLSTGKRENLNELLMEAKEATGEEEVSKVSWSTRSRRSSDGEGWRRALDNIV